MSWALVRLGVCITKQGSRACLFLFYTPCPPLSKCPPLCPALLLPLTPRPPQLLAVLSAASLSLDTNTPMQHTGTPWFWCQASGTCFPGSVQVKMRPTLTPFCQHCRWVGDDTSAAQLQFAHTELISQAALMPSSSSLLDYAIASLMPFTRWAHSFCSIKC